MIVWTLDGVLQDQIAATMELPKETVFIVVSPMHEHAFIPFPDGTIHLYDLSRLCVSPTKTIPHLDVSQDVVMDLAQNRSLDLLVIATTNSIYLWRFSTHNVERLYTLPDKSAFQPVCLALHPHEDIFMSGLADGRLAIWNTAEQEPLWITTVSELVGSPTSHSSTQASLSPVFKLSWRRLDSGSRLTVLGGNIPDEPPIITLDFSSTPFDSLENLMASNYHRHILSPRPINDFIDNPLSENLLLLTSDSKLELLDLSQEGVGRGAQSDLPYYQMRPPVKMARLVNCHTEMPVSFMNAENQRSIASGGLARPHQVSGGPNVKLAKYETPRLLLTLSSDEVVRFDNVSPHLLLSESSLASRYPNPLLNASLQIRDPLEDPLTWTFVQDASNIESCLLEFVPKSLEVFVGFTSGEVIVWKWSDGSTSPPKPTPKETDGRLLDMSTTNQREGFAPKVLLNAKAGPIAAFATSEIGFFAAAYANNSVLIVDMRGPSVLYEHVSPLDDKVILLKFSICKGHAKLHQELHLAIVHESGATLLLPIINENHGWNVGKLLEIPARKCLPRPIRIFLVEILSGEDLVASPMRLQELLSSKNVKENPKSTFAGEFYRVTVSDTAIACHHGWSSQELGTFSTAGIVGAGLLQKNGSACLVTYNTKGTVVISALPGLQTITELRTPFVNGELESASTISHSMEFSVLTQHGIEVWSLDDTRRAAAPDITIPKLHETQSQTVGLISWLLGSGMSGADFDALVAGPNRPNKPVSKVAESNADAISSAKNALAERGEALDSLAAQTTELEKTAGGMAEQAEKLASRQTKRHRFGF